MIVLKAGDWRAGLNPALGGSVTDLTWRGRPVLRPTASSADSPLQAACFPLVPYANRIAHGRFRFGGAAHDVGATPGFEPHALHGLGWFGAWAVELADVDRATLAFHHDGGHGWPWAFSALQRFVLYEGGLSIAVSMTSLAERPAPAGLGLHPYLHRAPGDHLTLAAPRVWTTDSTLIPYTLEPAETVVDWSDGSRLDDTPFVDNAYEGWDGAARLNHDGWTVALSSPGASRVHVYAPRAADFVCIEPVTHRPDALNAPGNDASGLSVLHPGQTLSLLMTIRAKEG